MNSAKKIVIISAALICVGFITFPLLTESKSGGNTNYITPENYIKNHNEVDSTSRSKYCILTAYSKFLNQVSGDTIFWMDGTKMVWDDKKKKSAEEQIENPDIEDMMAIEYYTGEKWKAPPPEKYDPGRARNELFFKKIYGRNSKEVNANLINVKWFSSFVTFNKINGAADSLRKVESALRKLDRGLQKYVSVTKGTFNWRNIAGTDKLSAHSFGIAIDINTDFSHYWRYGNLKKYQNKIPKEIIEVFERYGFIWGGKWYHYDTMHFEFRPEYFVK